MAQNPLSYDGISVGWQINGCSNFKLIEQVGPNFINQKNRKPGFSVKINIIDCPRQREVEVYWGKKTFGGAHF